MKKAILFTLALAAVGASASAQTLTMNGLVPGKNSLMWINNGAGGALSQFTNAGPFSVTLNPGAQTFESYCIQLGVAPATPTTSYLVTTPTITGNVAWLYNTYAASVTNSDLGAGLQVAIWEALYDTTFNIGADNFQVSAAPSVMAAANAFLSGLTSAISANPSAVSGATAFQYVGPQDNFGQNRYQTLIGPQPVPEPFTMALGGAAAAAFIRKRRMAKKA